jgi:hypothetical protein
MPWPDEPHCPPSGPTPRQHLDYIRARAQQKLAVVDPGLWARIRDAVDACKAGHCKIHGAIPAVDGTAPPNPPHCEHILWARCCADESNWTLCADELEHGV